MDLHRLEELDTSSKEIKVETDGEMWAATAAHQGRSGSGGVLGGEGTVAGTVSETLAGLPGMGRKLGLA